MTDTPGLDDAIEAAARAWLEPAARVPFLMESFRGTYPAAAVGRAVEAAYPVIVAATREAVATEILDVFDALGGTNGIPPGYWDGMKAAAAIARGVLVDGKEV